MPIEFKKLLDPAYQEQARKERQAREAVQEEKDRKIRAAVTLMQQPEHYDTLNDKERQFVRSCRMSISDSSRSAKSRRNGFLIWPHRI